MDSYEFILNIAIILIATKLLGIMTKRFSMPQVVGALLAGLILGPAMLGMVSETNFLNNVAEIGVIALMFTAGLETDIHELKKSGKSAFVIALCGVLVPLVGGFILAEAFNAGSENLLENIFIGIVLTATSVSITVETLRELGKLSTKSGNAILGAALIDDILGIVALTIISSLANPTISIGMVLFKIVAFFVLAGVVGVFLHKLIKKLTGGEGHDKRRYAVLSFAMCLLFAYVAEHFFGVADITGAYIAGLIWTNTSRCTYVTSKCETMSYMFFSPVFFASIGVKVALPEMSGKIILFSVLLILLSVVSKVVGCGLGAKLCRYTNADSIKIGVGMICRGEVALIVSTKGISMGLMNPEFSGPVILMVIASTMLTPILLKLVYRGKEKDLTDLVQSDLVDRYEEVQYLDAAALSVLDDYTQITEEIKQHQIDKEASEQAEASEQTASSGDADTADKS